MLDAAFRRCGVLRVDTIAELFYMAEVLAKQPRPRGPRLAIVTNAGGPGVLATDALIDDGGELAALSPETIDGARRLPARRTGATTTRSTSWATPTPDRYAKALEVAAKDPDTDGLLVDPDPAGDDRPDRDRRAAASRYAKIEGKPVLASWMGGEPSRGRRGDPQPGRHPDLRLSRHRRPRLQRHVAVQPTTSAASTRRRRCPPIAEDGRADRARADAIVAAARAAGRTLLTEVESKQLLAAYGIPTVATRVAADEDEAVAAADAIGYPGRPQAPLRDDHPQDRRRRRAAQPGRRRGGPPRLPRDRGVGRRARRRRAFPGRDRPADGQARRLRADRRQQPRPAVRPGAALRHRRPARRGLQGPRAGAAAAEHHAGPADDGADPDLHRAKGVRGRTPVDLAALEQLLVRFSQLVVEQPWIKEIDINPLLASPERLLALDARVILHGPEVDEADLPRPAIRPYPTPVRRRRGPPRTAPRC